MTTARPTRATALALAAVCALTVLGACGDPDRDHAAVAKEDRAVEQGNKAEAAYRAKIKAALRKQWQARARVLQAQARARAQRRAAARNGRTQVFVRTPTGSLRPAGAGDICAPIRPRFRGKAGRAERRARILRRKQALSYLNLRCPSLNTPRV